MNKVKVLVIKDEDGVLRPQAGIWADTNEGYSESVKKQFDYDYKKKWNGCTLVQAELTELN